MPGMGQAPQTDDPTVVSAFHTALAHQGLLIVLLLAVLAIAWNVVRTLQYRRLAAVSDGREQRAGQSPARRSLWPVGFYASGLQPSGSSTAFFSCSLRCHWACQAAYFSPRLASSRGWVQAVVNFGIEIWEKHPVQAAAATVWIQLGIGAMLLVASRGRWSRVAGVASVAWGLVVWAFGEAFGGIFAPGASWLFGAPGSVLLYVVAGALLATSRSLVVRYAARSAPRRRLGLVLPADGGSTGVARAGLLAGPRAVGIGDPRTDGRPDVDHLTAPRLCGDACRRSSDSTWPTVGR